jgi:nicotinate-nucleotide adenylyltransferase
MRLGLFGGSFDPVHYGHLLLAECCREQCGLDQVWFLPVAVPPHRKDHILAPAINRLEMLELAVAGRPDFSVCTYETDRGGVNYTSDTLAHFQEEDPQRELFLLMGADMLHDLVNWHEPARVCQLATLVVAGRPGTGPLDFKCTDDIVVPDFVVSIRKNQVQMPEIGISSTEIRRRVSAGQSIRYQIPRAVEEYIKSHGLYRQQT